MKKELTKVGFSEKLAEGIYQLIILNDKKQASQNISQELARLSDDKLPSQLLNWILETVTGGKQSVHLGSMSKELLNSIISIMLNTLMGEADEDLRIQVRNLILLGMKLI